MPQRFQKNRVPLAHPCCTVILVDACEMDFSAHETTLQVTSLKGERAVSRSSFLGIVTSHDPPKFFVPALAQALNPGKSPKSFKSMGRVQSI